jgi:hypothetical protein
MRPVETLVGMGEGNKGEWWNSMIHYKNFYKCHNVPPAQQ